MAMHLARLRQLAAYHQQVSFSDEWSQAFQRLVPLEVTAEIQVRWLLSEMKLDESLNHISIKTRKRFITSFFPRLVL